MVTLTRGRRSSLSASIDLPQTQTIQQKNHSFLAVVKDERYQKDKKITMKANGRFKTKIEMAGRG